MGLANDHDFQNHLDYHCKDDDGDYPDHQNHNDDQDNHEVRMQNLVLGGKGLANDDDQGKGKGKGLAKRGEFGVNCFVSNCRATLLGCQIFSSSSVCIIIVCIILIFGMAKMLIITLLILKLVSQLQRSRFRNLKGQRQLNSFSENSSLLEGQAFHQ